MYDFDDEGPMHVLHPEQSWDFLRAREFGRLAFHLVGDVHITPINYAVDTDNRIIFMTSEGSKLFGVKITSGLRYGRTICRRSR